MPRPSTLARSKPNLFADVKAALGWFVLSRTTAACTTRSPAAAHGPWRAACASAAKLTGSGSTQVTTGGSCERRRFGTGNGSGLVPQLLQPPQPWPGSPERHSRAVGLQSFGSASEVEKKRSQPTQS
jgi:hypothetical protein